MNRIYLLQCIYVLYVPTVSGLIGDCRIEEPLTVFNFLLRL
jgi:hypothetical protein